MARSSMTAFQATDPAWVVALRLAIHSEGPAADECGDGSVETTALATDSESNSCSTHREPARPIGAVTQGVATQSRY